MTRAFAAALIAALLLPVPPALAQRDAAVNAVPYYRPADVMAALYRERLVPAAITFEARSRDLLEAQREHCAAPGAALGQVHDTWRASVAAWERLAAVPVGTLIERRAVRRIDFTPARPEAIRRAVAGAPADAAAMERIGAAAKGLPALEWLLWTQRVRAATPGCDYAVQVAADVAREARAMAQAMQAAATQEWSEARADAAFGEWFNQWVGALERLRWTQIERPAREGGSRAAQVDRHTSGATAASWARRWQQLRAAAVLDAGATAPAPGVAPVPIETFLRGRGLNPLAGRWVRAIERADAAMRGLSPQQPPARRLAAAAQLSAVKRIAEADVAAAMNVQLGFSDADGD